MTRPPAYQQIAIRVDAAMAAALKRAALAEARSVAAQSGLIIREWLENAGYLPKQKTGARRA